MSAAVELNRQAGRIWSTKPIVAGDGLVSTFSQIHSNPLNRRPSITKVAFKHDGDEVAIVDDTGMVLVLRITRNRYISLDVAGRPGTAIAYCQRNRRYLFVAFKEHSIKCFDTAASTMVAELRGHHRSVTNITMRSSADEMVSTSGDCVILWDVQTLTKKRTLAALPSAAVESHYSRDGTSLLTLFQDGSICQWMAKDFSPVARIAPPQCLSGAPAQQAADSFCCSPDGHLLVTGHPGPLLLVWELPSRQVKYGLPLPSHAAGSTVLQLSFLPDSQVVAALVDGGGIQFVDVDAAKVAYRIAAPSGTCPFVHFTMDAVANSLLAVAADTKARLYDLAVVRMRPVPAQKLSNLAPSELMARKPSNGILDEGAEADDEGQTDQSGTDKEVRDAAVASKLPSRIRYASKPQPTWRKNDREAIQAPCSKSKQEDDYYHQALTALTEGRLTDAEGALSRQRLGDLLDAFGEYPAKYRMLIWSHLLQLPNNKEAFRLLQDRGPHPNYNSPPAGLHQQHSALLKRLSSTLSCLAHWCPLFAESSVVPGVAFPIVALCGRASATTFEMTATLLLNWCSGWFENFPHPPSALLFRLQALLLHHDEHLAMKLGRDHFCTVAWQLLSSLFSDILLKEQWLKLWDHCVTRGPAFLGYLLVAMLQSLRPALLAAPSAQRLKEIATQQQSIDIDKVLRKAYSLQATTPDHLQVGSTQFTPLPRGDAYPDFGDYPHATVEVLRGERERILEAEQALLRRRKVVSELEMRSKQVRQEAGALAAQREQLAALESQRRVAVREAERQLAAELARLDDLAKEQKLAQVNDVEQAYQRSLQAMRVDMERELEEVRREVEHKKGILAAQVRAKREEEEIYKLQHAADVRLAELQMDSMRQAATDKVKAELESRAAVLEAARKEHLDRWAAEDAVRKVRMQQEAERRARLAAAATEVSAKEKATQAVLAAEIAAKEELRKLAGDRALRQAVEAESALTAQQMQEERNRLEARARAQQHLLAMRAEADHAWFEEQQAKRKQQLEAEQEALKQERHRVARLQSDMESAGQHAAEEANLLGRWRALEQQNAEEEASCRRLLDALREERQRDASLEAQLLSTHRHLQEQLRHISSSSHYPPTSSPHHPSAPPHHATHHPNSTAPPPTSEPFTRRHHPHPADPSPHTSSAADLYSTIGSTISAAEPSTSSVSPATTSVPPATSFWLPFDSHHAPPTTLPPQGARVPATDPSSLFGAVDTAPGFGSFARVDEGETPRLFYSDPSTDGNSRWFDDILRAATAQADAWAGGAGAGAGGVRQGLGAGANDRGSGGEDGGAAEQLAALLRGVRGVGGESGGVLSSDPSSMGSLSRDPSSGGSGEGLLSVDEDATPEWIERMMQQHDAILKDLAEQRNQVAAEAAAVLSSSATSTTASFDSNAAAPVKTGDARVGMPTAAEMAAAAAARSNESVLTLDSSLSSLSLVADSMSPVPPNSRSWAATLQALGLDIQPES